MSSEKFEKNTDAKCFTHCVFEEINLFKGNKFDAESVVKLRDEGPIELRDFFKSGLERCKTISEGIEDKCEAGFAVHKCFGPPLALKNAHKH